MTLAELMKQVIGIAGLYPNALGSEVIAIGDRRTMILKGIYVPVPNKERNVRKRANQDDARNLKGTPRFS